MPIYASPLHVDKKQLPTPAPLLALAIRTGRESKD